MRNFCFTTLCLGTLLFASTGCRQTNGSFGSSLFGSNAPAANPFSPSGALTPMAPGQTPVLGTFQGVGPFGGSTRVSPPPTGSFSAPNNYGGSATPSLNIPAFQSSSNLTPPSFQSNPQQALASGNLSRPIGSGVQPAGWTETTANVPSHANSIGSRDISSDLRDPRAGGMQIIDMTGAPNPPGYRPAFSNSVQGYPSQNRLANPNANSLPFAAPYAARQTANTSRQQAFPLPASSVARKIPRFESRNDHPAYTSLPAADSNSNVRTADTNNLTWRRPGTR